MKFRYKMALAVFFVTCFNFFFIPFHDAYSKEVHITTCNDRYAIQVDKGASFEGHYIRCENYDEFYDHLNHGRRSEAKKLLLAPPPKDE